MKPLKASTSLLLSLWMVFSVPVYSKSIPVGGVPSDRDRRSTVDVTNTETAARSRMRSEVTFEMNKGQATGPVKFIARGGGMTTLLTGDSVWSIAGNVGANAKRELRGKLPADKNEPTTAGRSIVRMKFEGANRGGKVKGEREKIGKVNYLRGRDRGSWITGVPTFAAVRYESIYRGIDVVYYSNDSGEMEYDLVIEPKADPSSVALRFTGNDSIEIDRTNGDLVLGTKAGTIRHRRPIAYQEMPHGRESVAAAFKIASDGSVRFAIGDYDRKLPLIIDPVVGYSTYLGGTGDVDFVNSVAVDSAGNTYLAGSTNSTDFPTVSPFDATFGGDAFRFDAFVTKMNAAGTAVIYSTYLGGSGDDNGLGIAIDGSGQAYVTGFTDSLNFPTAGPFQNAINGSTYDAFVSKLNASGSALVYSTYFGGGQNDGGYSIVVDGAGSAIVAGETSSTDLPLMTPLQNTYGGGNSDAFVTKFTPGGNALSFSTYFGGRNDDIAVGLGLHSSGVYIGGSTASPDLPVTSALQGTYGGFGFFDGFVAKFTPNISSTVFSTYLGGSDFDQVSDLAVDGSGNVYVIGSSASLDYPVLGAFQANLNGEFDDVIAAKISSSGTLLYSTYLGGDGQDTGTGIAVDGAGAAFLTGSTWSSNFPTAKAVQATSGGQSDAFTAKLDPTGAGLVYSTYIGGASADDGIAIALDATGNAIVAGGTDSANFPLVNPFQNTRRGASDAFVLRLISSTTISGQVVDDSGRGLRNAFVTLTDQNGVRRQVLTSSAGFYSFEGVLTGEPYTLAASSKRFRFLPANVTPMQDSMTVNFAGIE